MVMIQCRLQTDCQHIGYIIETKASLESEIFGISVVVASLQYGGSILIWLVYLNDPVETQIISTPEKYADHIRR